MILQHQHRALYASFDRFPSEKGAARHIERMAQTLFRTLNGGFLYVLGDDELPIYQDEEGVEIFRFSQPIPNFLDRALQFGKRLEEFLNQQQDSLRICHFRDPWSGVPILRRQNRRYTSIYEVNGLPSIELPCAYPQLAPRTLQKIRAAEEFCWTHADKIITPSATIKENLIRLGAASSKIVVIPNGADIRPAPPRPVAAPARYLIYFGAVQKWQGIDVLLRAFALLKDFEDLRLVLCISTHPRQARSYVALAERLQLGERILWMHRLNAKQLLPWIAHAEISIAPLTECSRNLEQGCCPLKILESMAAGVPTIASNLPSVREIITDGVDGKLVPADRPTELARAIRVLLEYPERRTTIGTNARNRIETALSWKKSMQQLAEFYMAIVRQQTEELAGTVPQPVSHE